MENANPRPVTLRQLCAIARAVFDSAIDDSEWRERIKCRLTVQGWAYPRPDQIGEAMTRVELVLAGEGQSRPVPAIGHWV